VERIQYGCSKFKPISKKSLLNILPDIYNEKCENDNRADLEGNNRMFLDEFLLYYMKDKFHLKKIIKKNSEEFIMGILKYSKEDTRIDLIRRFLGIGDDKYRREILDIYLTFLKSKFFF
jgi:hypothetical protein